MKRQIILLLLFLLPFVCFFIGNRAAYAPPPGHFGDLTKEQMIEDYEIFWDKIEKYHTSLEMLEEEDLQRVREEYLLKISRLGRGSAREYLGYYIETIRELHGIGHLQICTESLF